jgi:hypothetical protein
MTVLRYVKFGRVSSGLTIRLKGEQGALAERRFRSGEFSRPLPSNRELVVSLGGDAGVADAVRQMRRRAEEQVVGAAVDDPRRLPDHWRGYDGVDTLVLVGDAKFLEQLGEPQREALLHWVRLGGRMVLSVGSRGEAVLGEAGVLASLAPGRFVGVTPLRRSGGLENFISASERLAVGEGQAGDLLMTVLDDVRGRIDVAQTIGPTARPMVVRYPVGFGQVTLLTVDLDRGPIAAWRERGKLVRRLVEGPAGSEGAEHGAVRGRVSHIGFEDLIGQLRAALDSFPEVTPVAFSWVAALVILYAALIGPVDFFVLRRWGKKMERTWLTFPLIVSLFCLLAWAGVGYFRPNQLLVNQVEILDLDVDSGLARGTMWAHVYSPATARFDAALAPRSAVAEASGESGSILTWQGLPGGGLGGMNSAAGELYNAPYRIVERPDEGSLQIDTEGLPIQIRSTRSLTGRWWTSAQATDLGRLTVSPDGVLEGEIVNPLTVPVRDALLAYNHWSYRIRQELAPGARARLQGRLPDDNLVWRLTQRRLTEEYKEFSTPWDETTRNVPRIIEMLMWHGAAGGRGYTGLLHRYQGDIDLSEHLRTGRAVLIARVETPAAELTLDGQMVNDAVRRWTWYRVVFPVAAEE